MSDSYDLAIVGAGLSTHAFLRARAALHRDETIVVIEHEAVPGGALRHLLPAPEFPVASALLDPTWWPARVELRPRATAVGFLPATRPGALHTLLVREAAGTTRLTARRIILAGGGVDRPREHDQIPGTRPAGIVTPSFVLQSLAAGYLPGRHALVYGASSVAAITARRLVEAGVATVLLPPLASPAPPLESVTLRRDDQLIEWPVDTLVYAVGLVPTTGWLKGSGVTLGEAGEVMVNESGETTLPGVFAIGTVVAPSPDHLRSIDLGELVARTLGGA